MYHRKKYEIPWAAELAQLLVLVRELSGNVC